MNRLMLVPLSICWIHVAHIAHAASPTIADDTYVAEAVARNAVIWDVRTADAYLRKLVETVLTLLASA